MFANFPWPVMDDELVLNQALEDVLVAREPCDNHETSLLRDAAGRLILEAYEQGVRDREPLARHALKALKAGPHT
jgi:hypothetical protein